MKIAKMLCWAMLALMTTVMSCKKDKDNDPDSKNEEKKANSFSAQFDGDPFLSTAAEALVEMDYTVSGSAAIGVSAAAITEGGSSLSATISFVTEDFDALKAGDTFTAADQANAANGAFVNILTFESFLSLNTSTMENDAIVTVTSIDKLNQSISGTFSFTAYNFEEKSVVVTDGEFHKVSYQVQ